VLVLEILGNGCSSVVLMSAMCRQYWFLVCVCVWVCGFVVVVNSVSYTVFTFVLFADITRGVAW
jgi:hypothetical protein